MAAASRILKPAAGEPIGAPYKPDANAYDPVAADGFYFERLPVVISHLFNGIGACLTGREPV